jgi:hypothetical protein
MPTNSIAQAQSPADSIGGCHHCIGSGQAVVDLAFRHLHASCASLGGKLTESDLTAAHADLLESFSSSLDYFAGIHQRCMDASGVTTPTIFTPGRMLSSLLFVCSKRIAAHCFRLQLDRLGADWLRLFFDAFSESIRRRACPDAETRLDTAYVKAAGKLRQKLSIKKFLLEQDVQDVLRDCILPFRKAEVSAAMALEMSDEVNHCMGMQSGNVCPHVSKITIDQMRKFLSLFPSELSIMLI